MMSQADDSLTQREQGHAAKLGDGHFDRSANDFARATDETITAGRWRRGELFLDLARREIAAGGRVLDYGCGPGRMALRLAREGYRVDGVDASANMIEAAQLLTTQAPALSFRCLTTQLDGFQPESYDGIVCSSVIEFVADDEALLKGFHSWLKPGGTAIISFANRRSLWRFYAKARFGSSMPLYQFQKHVYTASEFKSKAEASGFRVAEKPKYFDSPFDYRAGFSLLAGLSMVGTLGLVLLKRDR
ncbi:MAG: class I SAM-dependent methyltransferase [Pyrinomonadaceae bacterium]